MNYYKFAVGLVLPLGWGKDRLATLTESPKRKGFLFTDWYLDKKCTKPLTSKVLTLGNDNGEHYIHI